MDPDVELRLVAALRRSDQSAFRPLYEAYSAGVFSFILRMVNRRAIAEELAQEVWMRLAVRAGSLREGTRLEPWLFTVARNLCVSYWRTRGVEGLHDGDRDTLEAVTASETLPDRAAESREMRVRLERALSRLPRPYREALLLVGVHGLTPAAAATVCEVAPEAMRKRLERARTMLAQLMEVQRGCGDDPVPAEQPRLAAAPTDRRRTEPEAARREPMDPEPTAP